MIVDVVLDILETHSRSVPKKMMEELMIYASVRNVVQMQFVILDSVSVLLALKVMIHTMLQSDVRPSPNVLDQLVTMALSGDPIYSARYMVVLPSDVW